MTERLLKVLYTESARAYWGQERYIHRLMRVMRQQGHTVEALCQPHSDLVEILRDDGFTVHTFRMNNPIQFWKNLFPIRNLITRHGYDVVNTNSRRDTIHAGAAARLAKKPLVIRTRHLAKPVNSLVAYSWIPHRVIAASHFVRQMIIDRGMAEDYIDVAHPAVALPPTLPSQKLRLELGLTNGEIIIGSIGALRRDKAFHELIQAAAPILHNNRKTRMVIIGEGSERPELEALVDKLNIVESVYLLGQRRDVPELIGDFSLFCLATHIEASGTAFAEAAAANLPTVGYDTTGVPEMVKNGESGFLVPLSDIEALTQAIQRLVDNPERKRR